MSLINVQNLTFSYEGSYTPIFENVNFQIDTDWKLGFTGRNGRGKTTFLSLLLGKYAYSGSISAQTEFAYFPYTVNGEERITADIVQEIVGEYENWRLIKELNAIDVDSDVLYRPFCYLSGGEQTKILLASLFLKDNQFLLLDEPTNHLDLKGRELVSRYLSTKKGFILVSHDRAFMDGCVDHILSINKSNIEVRKGNFSAWWENKELQDEYERKENERLQKDIAHLTTAAKRTAAWSDTIEKSKLGTRNSGLRPDRGYIGHKSAKMMQRSKAIQNRQQSALAEKSGLLKNLETADNLKLQPLSFHTERLVSLENVSVFYGDSRVNNPVHFSVSQGERIALCGKNGSGKSSLLKLISGEPLSYAGTLTKSSQLKISYVPQTTVSLSGNLSDYAAQYGINESQFKAILRKLDFSRSQFEKDMLSFSDGQKKKVLLARSLCEQAHLYLWDEPLNYIDVISRMQIEELLLAFQPTLLFVEHDRLFCENIATKIIAL